MNQKKMDQKKIFFAVLLNLSLSLFVGASAKAEDAPKKCVVDVQSLVDEDLVNIRRIGITGRYKRDYKPKWESYIIPEISLGIMSVGLSFPVSNNVTVFLYSSNVSTGRWVLRPERTVHAPHSVTSLSANFTASSGTDCIREPILDGKRDLEICYHYYKLVDYNGKLIDQVTYAERRNTLARDEEIQYQTPGGKTGKLIQLIKKNAGLCNNAPTEDATITD